MARRDLLKLPLALAAGSLAAPWGQTALAKPTKKTGSAAISPNYYPVHPFKPEINLKDKVAVITGASRGIGRATGEALADLGVYVIGTSRDPENVPDPPDFPLLQLDISDPESLFLFPGDLQQHLSDAGYPFVDILINNAGRSVLGQIVPSPSGFNDYLAARQLGVATLYFGHVVVTNAVLPFLPPSGYARIGFTVSISGYITAAENPLGSFQEVYASMKAALRGYANNLDGAFKLAASHIRAFTVNPYFVDTGGLTHPRPIYTQPVNDVGLSDTDAVFNAIVTYYRGLQDNGLPPAMVGEAYAQLLRMDDPDQNVVVAAAKGPLVANGPNDLIEAEFINENLKSAVPFVPK